MTISSPGIGSGIDVDSIVTQLMSIEQQPLTDLKKKETSYQAKISAFGTLKGSLSAFQNSLTSLNTTAAFNKFIPAVSDSTILSATASTNAVAGSYALNVTQLAQAQSLYSAGQADTTTSIGSGAATTVRFDFGTISGGTLTGGVYSGASFASNSAIASGSVTIDSSNNTLSGIRDAINAANVGVSATIVNDGSATPNRLVLTSSTTGLASSIKVSVSGDAALASLLGNDPAGTQNLTQSQAALNANLTVNGLAISSASNTVNGSLQGITLNLQKTGATNITTSLDQASIQKSIQSFVSTYNDTAKTVASLTSYNATTKAAGLLLGDSAVQMVQSSLRNMLNSTIPGGAYTSLSQIGVSFQRDGTLALDNSKLTTALNTNPSAVGAVFATAGKTTDSLVSYSGASTLTTPGDYAVNVSTIATHGQALGSAALSASTVIDATNDTLAFSLDGVASSVTLTHNSYTPAQLAAQVQAAINSSANIASAGLGVAASQSGGLLSLLSNSYGSASALTVSGNALATLFGTATSTSGVNVAGSIGGYVATASGQTLTGSGTTQGLSLTINGGATGNRGIVSVTQGLTDKLNALLDGLVKSDGLLAGRTDGLQRSIKDIDAKTDALNIQLAATEKRYRAQYSALDTTISSLKSTSTYLTQQLGVLNGTQNSGK